MADREKEEVKMAWVINKAVKALERMALVDEATFVNVTPLWIGDAYGHTVTEHGPYPVAVPTAQAIVGRARWVIKTLANIVRNSYRLDRVDYLASDLFGEAGKKSRASNYRIVVRIERVCGESALYLRHSDVQQLISRLPRNRITENDIKCIQEMISILQCYGYAELLREMGLPNQANTVDDLCKDRQRRRLRRLGCYYTIGAITNFISRVLSRARQSNIGKGYLKLLTVPRYYLLVHGLIASRANDECRVDNTRNYRKECVIGVLEDVLYRMQPLPPKCVQIRLRLFKRSHTTSLQDKVAWASIYLALTYLGIGKAASRGFGRLAEAETNSMNDIIKAISGNITLILRNHLQSPKDVNVYNLLTNVKHPCPFPPFLWPRITISGNTANLTDQRGGIVISNIPCIIGKRNVRSVEGLLSALGHATLKAMWKLSKGNLMGSGKHYHTWVLGLPRSAKKGRSLTGYLLHVPRQASTNARGHYQLEEGRRASAIHLTPVLPSGGTGSSGVLVTVLTPIRNDLDIITVNAQYRQVAELYHHSGVTRPNRVSILMGRVEHPTGRPVGTTRSIDVVETATKWIIHLIS